MENQNTFSAGEIKPSDIYFPERESLKSLYILDEICLLQ